MDIDLLIDASAAVAHRCSTMRIRWSELLFIVVESRSRRKSLSGSSILFLSLFLSLCVCVCLRWVCVLLLDARARKSVTCARTPNKQNKTRLCLLGLFALFVHFGDLAALIGLLVAFCDSLFLFAPFICS